MPDGSRVRRFPGEATRHGGLTTERILGLGTIASPPLLAAAGWRLLRPEDLLVLHVSFVNLVREGGQFRRIDRDRPAHLIVRHQFQAIGEQALLDTADQQASAASDAADLNPKGPSASDIEALPARFLSDAAGPSRLVFAMPEREESIPASIESVLEACRRWPLVLTALAEPDVPGIVKFADLEAARLAAEELLGGPVVGVAAGRLAAGAAGLARRLLAEERGLAARTLQARLEALRTRAFGPAARLAPDARAAADALTRIAFAEAAHAAIVAKGGIDGLAPAVLGHLLDLGTILPLFRAPHPPGLAETALEIPYRLFATPLPGAGFAHATVPVARQGRTELWNSRLGIRHELPGAVSVDDRPGEPGPGGWRGPMMRFVWSPDYADPSAQQYRQPLDRLDRQMLVRLTAGFNEKRPGGKAYAPRAFHVRRLMLTAMGGDLEAERRFATRPEGVDLVAWVHRAAIGRDYLVRVEYAGFLYPFGHRAVLVKLTERRFEWRGPSATGDRIAPLRQRFFLVVRDRVVAYPQGSPMRHAGRGLPFREVHCLVEQTPTLAEPGARPQNRIVLPLGFYPSAAEHRRAFWPALGHGEELYRFPFAGRDGAGRLVRFELPVLFVSEAYNHAGRLGVIRAHYNDASRRARREADLAGQTVRLGPAAAGAADVDHPVGRLVLRAEDPAPGVSAQELASLQAFPRLAEAEVRLATIERLTGARRDLAIAYDEGYLANGYGTSALFACAISPEPLAFGGGLPSDSVGGIATPDLVPSGLSARHGLASGDLDSFAGGTFDPAKFLPDAKLLGFFPLKSLLKSLPLTAGEGVPQITSTETGTAIETRFRLVQRLDPGEKLPGLVTGAGGPSDFTLDARVIQPKSGVPPRRDVEGTLTNFKVNLAGVIIIRFDRLRFLSVDGRKPDVDVDLNPEHGITFGGPLEFVNRLKDFIPANGFSDPPQLSVTPAGVTAGYSLGLPAIQVGALSLSNVTLGASFTLPFDGKAPTARFNFAERHNCFNLTVSMYGGGGFVALVVAPDGVREIEAALEFGARIAIDLGVASGSVYVKGGFYFHYSDEMLVFEGYVELGGRLSVLGLITASLVFHLSLAYRKLEKGPTGRAPTELVGQATLVVEVEVLLFSASVEVKVERRFKGGEADPLFIDFMPTADSWTEYCDAFA